MCLVLGSRQHGIEFGGLHMHLVPFSGSMELNCQGCTCISFPGALAFEATGISGAASWPVTVHTRLSLNGEHRWFQ